MIDVLILRGAPGIGKSTVGKRLLTTLEQGAVLEVDAFRAAIARVDWDSEVHHYAAIDSAMAVARTLALYWSKNPVVVLDTFCGDKIHDARNALLGLNTRTVSLWLDPGELRRRVESRPCGYSHWPSIQGVNDEIGARTLAGDRVIDVTGMAVSDVTAAVMEVMCS